jgi:hypothetical protein
MKGKRHNDEPTTERARPEPSARSIPTAFATAATTVAAAGAVATFAAGYLRYRIRRAGSKRSEEVVWNPLKKKEGTHMAKKKSSDQGGVEGQTAGTAQAKMPTDRGGEFREGDDGKVYHYSDAEKTHVVPERTPDEIESKTQTDPAEAIEEQKDQGAAPENKAA